MSVIRTIHDAKKRPSEHIFVPGAGYVYKGPIKPLKHQMAVWGAHPKDLCDPPAGIHNESWHALMPPSKSKPVTFQWLAAPREWFRLGESSARRLGFSPAYLSSHGWRYFGPARNRHG